MLLTACSPKIADKISWQSIPVNVDGQAIEYQHMRNYINETKMTYSLSNDRKNLYLCLRTSDETMQKKIMRAGMEIWIDTTVREKKITGILFPLANGYKMKPEVTGLPLDGERQRPDFSIMKQKFLLGQTFMQLEGFRHVPNGLSHLENNSGIKVRINWDSTNAMVYEASVPFKTFYRESLTAKDSIKVFSLTININAVTMPHMQQGGGQGREGHGGEGRGGEGRGGGEMSGGHHPDENGMEDRSATPGKITFSKKFRLEIKTQ